MPTRNAVLKTKAVPSVADGVKARTFYASCGDISEHIDSTCSTYKGLKVGDTVFEASMFNANEFSEHRVIGFTPMLGVGNRFVVKPLRRVITAYLYKGKVEAHSHMVDQFVAQLPSAVKIPMCKYCKRREANPLNNGACMNARCRLQAMRDSL